MGKGPVGAQSSWVGRHGACGGQCPLHLCTGGGRSPRSVVPGAAEGDASHPARVGGGQGERSAGVGTPGPAQHAGAHRPSFAVSLSFQENVSSSFEVLQLLIKCILVVIWRIGLFTRVTAGL